MGNCLRKESEMQWGGEYWGSPKHAVLSASPPAVDSNDDRLESRMIPEETGRDFDSEGAKTEMKIRISKKQLQQLLDRAMTKDLTLREVLAQLVNSGEGQIQHGRKPMLQSIPE